MVAYVLFVFVGKVKQQCPRYLVFCNVEAVMSKVFEIVVATF